MTEAYVLLNCELGREKEVITELRAIQGVSSVKTVFGVYDIIATVTGDSDKDIKKIVAKIRSISSVRSSITMIVAEEYGD